MIEMDSQEICKLLDILIGNPQPVGDSAIDEQRKRHLLKLIDVGNWVLSMISEVAQNRHSEYFSMREIGEWAYATMLQWEEWLSEQEEENA